MKYKYSYSIFMLYMFMNKTQECFVFYSVFSSVDTLISCNWSTANAWGSSLYPHISYGNF